MEAEFNHLNHATWYRVVFTPASGPRVSRSGATEGVPDRGRTFEVAQIIGYMKGMSSIWIAQNVERKMRNFMGHKFWARGTLSRPLAGTRK
jgi:hypothetical protein